MYNIQKNNFSTPAALLLSLLLSTSPTGIMGAADKDGQLSAKKVAAATAMTFIALAGNIESDQQGTSKRAVDKIIGSHDQADRRDELALDPLKKEKSDSFINLEDLVPSVDVYEASHEEEDGLSFCMRQAQELQTENTTLKVELAQLKERLLAKENKIKELDKQTKSYQKSWSNALQEVKEKSTALDQTKGKADALQQHLEKAKETIKEKDLTIEKKNKKIGAYKEAWKSLNEKFINQEKLLKAWEKKLHTSPQPEHKKSAPVKAPAKNASTAKQTAPSKSSKAKSPADVSSSKQKTAAAAQTTTEAPAKNASHNAGGKR